MSDHADVIRDGLDAYWDSPSEYHDALDALVAERDEANVQWHKIRDLHADAVSEVARLRTDLENESHAYERAREEVARLRVSVSDACDQLQRGIPIGVEMAERILSAALATPTKECAYCGRPTVALRDDGRCYHADCVTDEMAAPTKAEE